MFHLKIFETFESVNSFKIFPLVSLVITLNQVHLPVHSNVFAVLSIFKFIHEFDFGGSGGFQSVSFGVDGLFGFFGSGVDGLFGSFGSGLDG